MMIEFTNNELSILKKALFMTLKNIQYSDKLRSRNHRAKTIELINKIKSHLSLKDEVVFEIPSCSEDYGKYNIKVTDKCRINGNTESTK